jgi:hypothetical protein
MAFNGIFLMIKSSQTLQIFLHLNCTTPILYLHQHSQSQLTFALSTSLITCAIPPETRFNGTHILANRNFPRRTMYWKFDKEFELLPSSATRRSSYEPSINFTGHNSSCGEAVRFAGWRGAIFHSSGIKSSRSRCWKL